MTDTLPSSSSEYGRSRPLTTVIVSGGGGGGSSTSPSDIASGIDLSTDVNTLITKNTEISTNTAQIKTVSDEISLNTFDVKTLSEDISINTSNTASALNDLQTKFFPIGETIDVNTTGLVSFGVDNTNKTRPFFCDTVGVISVYDGLVEFNTDLIADTTSNGTLPSRHSVIGAKVETNPSVTEPLVCSSGGYLITDSRFISRYYDPSKITTIRVHNSTLATGTIISSVTNVTSVTLLMNYIETLTNNITYLQLFISASAPVNGSTPLFAFKCLGSNTAGIGDAILGNTGLLLGSIPIGQSLFWGFSSTAATLTTSANARSLLIKTLSN
jgi:hypothetical protein